MMNRYLQKHPRVSILLLFAAVGLLIYSRVILQAGFLFDDFEYVVGNPIVDDFSELLKNFSDPRQLGYLTFALNYLIGQASPVGYHLVNVLVHIANACLVFLLAGQLLQLAGRHRDSDENKIHFLFPAAAGLIFLVHPLQTQAVSYITQRFTSLAVFFYLSALVLYLSARMVMTSEPQKRRIPARYWVALACAIAAMKVKEIAVTLPVAIVLLEALFLSAGKERLRSFYLLVPFVATIVIIPLALFAPDWGLMDKGVGIAETTRILKIEDLSERSPFEYFATQTRMLFIYLRLLFFPYPQSAVYDITASRSLFELKVILALVGHLILASLAAGVWFASRRSTASQAPFMKLIAVGIGWFYLTASVESSFLPIKDLIFEHRAYLPGIGIILATLAALVLATRAHQGMEQAVRTKLIAAVCMVALVLAVMTFARNRVWLDEMVFWEDVVQKIPNKAIGYHNRGNALVREGRIQEAIQDIDRTIAMFEPFIGKKLTWENADYTPSNMSKTYLNRGTIFEQLGDMARANADYETAKKLVMLQPIDLDETRKLADIFYRKGAYTHAIKEYNKVLAWFPDDLNAINDRANSLSLSGSYTEAISDFTVLISKNPGAPLLYYNRGVAYARSGDTQKAVADLNVSCKMKFQPACDGIAAAAKGGN